MYGIGGSRLGRVQGSTGDGFEPEREDMSTFLFEHDPGAQGIRGRIHDMALLELRGDGGKLQSMHDTYPNREYGAGVLYV